MSPDLIIYGLVAAGLVFWLRSILGTRHGEERQRPNPLAMAEARAEKKQSDEDEFIEAIKVLSAEDKIVDLAENPTGVLFIDNKTAENGLIDIARADKSFDIKTFLDAAQDAFVYVVEAFAEGDRATLKDLLGPRVEAAFEHAIDDREKRGETQMTEIQAVNKVEVLEAELDGREARVSVKFTADETSVTKDKDGEILAGHPDKTSKMVDIWTFARDVKSRDPRWLVVETRGDFEWDNELIPDTE